MYREDIVKQAQAFLGKKESNNSHREIIDIYNAHKPLPRGYKVKYTDEWCATTVSAVAIACNATSIIPIECSCEKMIELFKEIGCWHENENYTPKTGDIIFYDWADNGKGDNKGWSDHVGIVEKVSNGNITVIEGNYGKAVKRRNIKVNNIFIRGYGLPMYKEKKEVSIPNLKNYSGNSLVDGLKSIDYDHSFESRKALWKKLGYLTDYKGTASQNTTMLNILKTGYDVKIELPSLKGYKGFSLVDGLTKFGYKSTFAYRKSLWKAIGKTSTYKGTALQNTTLLNYLKGV